MGNIKTIGIQVNGHLNPLFRPSGQYAYTDELTAWLPWPLDRKQFTWLNQQCRVRPHNEPAAFNPRLKQRLQLYLPNPEVLAFINRLPGVHINYVALALDWTFDNESDCNEAFDLVSRFHVKKHHRDQGVRNVKGVTRYSGPRGANNVVVVYCDKPSRITGEVHCLHMEWRIRRHSSLRAAGITKVADLLRLDHRKFWANRLLLATFDLRKLGRRHRYHFHGPAKGRSWISVSRGGVPYDHDLRVGRLISSVTKSGATQDVLDVFGPKFRLYDCLKPFDVSHLLPNTDSLGTSL